MRVPKTLRIVDERGAIVRTYEYQSENDGEGESESVIAVDFGQDSENLTADVVGDTVIVTDDRQFEFDLPAEASTVTMNNGVLTIR